MTDEKQELGTEDTENTFEIPWRPERIAHESHPVLNNDGTPATDENGEIIKSGGGSTIKGYTQFTLTTDAFDREEIGAVLSNADDWGSYVLSQWEPYNQLVYDLDEGCPFEVRVLEDRVAVDVKSTTTSTSIKQFVTEFAERLNVEFEVERDSERIAA